MYSPTPPGRVRGAGGLQVNVVEPSRQTSAQLGSCALYSSGRWNNGRTRPNSEGQPVRGGLLPNPTPKLLPAAKWIV